jgi:uncharacterized protein (TIGR02001 family)
MNHTKPSLRLAVLGTVVACASASGLASAQTASAPQSTLTSKVSLYSEYEYRGISQTSQEPAVQFNLDYAHPSGFYAGVFASNIKWVGDTLKELQRANPPASQFTGGKGRVEVDLFAGYKFEVVKDVTLDVGYLRYEYPASEAIIQNLGTSRFTVLKKANTDELYLGVTYGAFTLKHSQAFSDAFGIPNSKNTTFTELNWSQEIAPKLVANAQVARQKWKNFDAANLTVYKLGATYDAGNGWNVGAYFKTTTANSALYTYLGTDWSKSRLVAFVSKTF